MSQNWLALHGYTDNAGLSGYYTYSSTSFNPQNLRNIIEKVAKLVVDINIIT